MSTSNSEQTIKFTGVQVPDILTWKSPYETGILFVEALGFFVVFSSKITLRYCLKISALVIGILSFAEIVTRALSGPSKGLVSSYRPSRFLPLNDAVVNEVAGYVSQGFRRIVFGTQSLLDAKNPVFGLQLAGAFYFAYFALRIFNLKTLILTSILTAFTIPSLYLHFKEEVDGLVNQGLQQLDGYLNVAWEKVSDKLAPQINGAKKVLKVGEHKPQQTKSDATESNSATASTEPQSFGTESVTPSDVQDIVNEFDSVPTFQGNVPIQKEELSAKLQNDYEQATANAN